MNNYNKNIFLLILLLLVFLSAKAQNEYNELIPILVCKTNQVMIGENLKVEIYFNRKITHNINADFGSNFKGEISIENEKIIITKKCQTAGVYELIGKISFFDNEQQVHQETISFQYFVIQPAVLVSNIELSKKLILNKENSLEISVQGYPNFLISATTDNGKLKKSGINYLITPTNPGNCKIHVFAKKNNELVLLKTENFIVIE